MQTHTSALVALCLCVVARLAASDAADGRDARWLNGAANTVTKLYVDNLIVTSVVPSSCAAVASTLPPCRGLRFLNIDRIFPSAVGRPNVVEKTISPLPEDPYETRRHRPDKRPQQHDVAAAEEPSTVATPQLPAHAPPSPPSSSPAPSHGLFNGGYFDFMRGATVTKTATRLLTQTVFDPARTVTFSIKVCRPSRMPFDLPPCDGASLVEAAPEPIGPTVAATTTTTTTATMQTVEPSESFSV